MSEDIQGNLRKNLNLFDDFIKKNKIGKISQLNLCSNHIVNLMMSVDETEVDTLACFDNIAHEMRENLKLRINRRKAGGD